MNDENLTLDDYIKPGFIEDKTKELNHAALFFCIHQPSIEENLDKLCFNQFKKYLVGFQEYVSLTIPNVKGDHEAEDDLIDIIRSVDRLMNLVKLDMGNNEKFKIDNFSLNQIYTFGSKCVNNAVLGFLTNILGESCSLAIGCLHLYKISRNDFQNKIKRSSQKKFYVEATEGAVPLNDIYDEPDSRIYVFESKEEALNFVWKSNSWVCFLCAQIITKKKALKILERKNPLIFKCGYYHIEEIKSKFYDKPAIELVVRECFKQFV